MVNYKKSCPSSARNQCLKCPSAVSQLLMVLLAVACSVHSNGTATGGVTLDAATGCTADGAATECTAGDAASRCPAGVAAVLGDSSYSSSQVALLGLFSQ